MVNKLGEELRGISAIDQTYIDEANRHWDEIAKPLHGLGALEDLIAQIAGITRNTSVKLDKRALLICCADNGVVSEGISQSGQEVTAMVAENFHAHKSSVCLMAEHAKCDVFAYDVGIAVDTSLPGYKVAYGTGNIAAGPAMMREQALQIIQVGIDLVKEKKEQGYQILATGEMGIGNTTTSSAVAAVLLGLDPALVTGKGAGLSDSGLTHKIEVVRKAIAVNQPDPKDPIDVLSKVGGFDIAAMCGIFLGGAIYRIPVVIDGFISAVAGLLAARILPEASGYMLPSHLSGEGGAKLVLEELGKKPPVTAGMALGEGTGAICLLPLLDLALAVYYESNSFEDIALEPYQHL